MIEEDEELSKIEARLLACFTGSAGHVHEYRLSADELFKRYHSRYTLSFFHRVLKKIVWRRRNERDLHRALSNLVQFELVEMMLLHFTDRPLRVGVKYYSLTQKGIQHLGSRTKKKKK